MSVVLLDTTFLINAERADIALDDLIREDDDIAIAAITVAELVVGVELASPLPRPTDRLTWTTSSPRFQSFPMTGISLSNMLSFWSP